MRTLLIALLTCAATPLQSQRVELGTGSIYLPEGFSQESLRGNGSSAGIFIRPDKTLTIQYDIAAVAGPYMEPERRSECIWFIEHDVGGRRAFTGVTVVGARRVIATTVLGEGTNPGVLPANFVAAVGDDKDLAEFLVIVTSYLPNDGP